MHYVTLAVLWLGALTFTCALFWARLLAQRGRLGRAAPGRLAPVSWPRVTVAVPLSAADNVDTLAAAEKRVALVRSIAAYPSEVRVLFLASVFEPLAQARAQRHVAALRRLGVAVSWLCTAPRGLNRKAAQLASIDPAVYADGVLVTVDSDVALGSIALRPLVARLLAGDRPGAVWMATAPHGKVTTLGDRVSQAVLAASSHAFAFIATLTERDAVGKVLALNPQALAEAGGFAPGIACVGDDVSISNRLFAHGYPTRALAAPVARTQRTGESLGHVYARFVRWVHIMLRHRPQHALSYPLFLFPLPLLLGLWVLAAQHGVLPAYAAAGAVASLVLRAWQARLCRLASHHPAHWGVAIVDVILAEMFLASALTLAPLVRRVRWHNRVLEAERA